MSNSELPILLHLLKIQDVHLDSIRNIKSQLQKLHPNENLLLRQKENLLDPPQDETPVVEKQLFINTSFISTNFSIVYVLASTIPNSFRFPYTSKPHVF
jgi:hypothetical protein